MIDDQGGLRGIVIWCHWKDLIEQLEQRLGDSEEAFIFIRQTEQYRRLTDVLLEVEMEATRTRCLTRTSPELVLSNKCANFGPQRPS